MTREQMIDVVVRQSMKPISMRRAVAQAEFVSKIRLDCVPHQWNPDSPEPENGADVGWWDGTIPEQALSMFPGRVREICFRFRAVAEEKQM